MRPYSKIADYGHSVRFISRRRAAPDERIRVTIKIRVARLNDIGYAGEALMKHSGLRQIHFAKHTQNTAQSSENI